MIDSQGTLFGRPGYISLREYMRDIYLSRKYGPWRLKLSFRSRFQFFLLNVLVKISWYSNMLFILHPYLWSPAYTLLLAVLKERNFYDSLEEKCVPNKGLYSYRFIKKIDTPRGEYIMRVRGTDRSPIVALSKAMGELMERSITGFYNQDRKVISASPKMHMRGDIRVYYPPIFHRRLKIQIDRLGARHHSGGTPIEWVTGVNMISREKTYIPRQIAMWGSNNYKIEGVIQHTTTNGSAGFFTEEGASLRAILEIVHRDGLLVHWLTMIAPPRIRPESLPPRLRAVFDEISALGISLYILNVTAIPIPSIVVAAISEQADTPQAILGGAAAATFEEAIQIAMDEIAVVSWRFEVEPDPINVVEEEPEPFLSYLNHSSRQTYWRGNERIQKLRWFLSGSLVNYTEIVRGNLKCKTGDKDNLEECLRLLQSLGKDYYPIIYYPSHPILRELGYLIVQIFIPKAFPLYLTEIYGTFDSDRLKEFAHSKGKEKWTLNPNPHLFS